jgi:quinol-cytochrome oxidoreductase complex cytochrome b subunit
MSDTLMPSHQETRKTVPSVPDLLRKEVLAAVVTLALLVILSAALDAPLQGPADVSGIPPEHVKAPWIFVGIQQMLRYLPATVAGVVIPVAAVLASVLLPFLFARKRALVVAIVSGLWIVLGIVTLWGYFA